MKNKEIIIYVLFVIIINSTLLLSGINHSMTLTPDTISGGEYWRAVTHPFVHASIYHTILDLTGFIFLYIQLTGKTILQRSGIITGCWLGSLAAVMLQLPTLETSGFCGLSGISYGLMAVVLLETAKIIKEMKWTCIIMLILLASKCLYETLAGKLLFESWHIGYVGTPVTISHLGGIIGGIAGYCILNRSYIITKLRNVSIYQKALILNHKPIR